MLAMLNDPALWISLSDVLVGFFAKQAVAQVVSRSAGVLPTLSNLDPLVGERRMSAEGWTRAGGLGFGLRALGVEAGCTVARWLVIAHMAAAGSKSNGAWNEHPPEVPMARLEGL